MGQVFAEADANVGSNDRAGWVADQGGRPSDIRSQDLGDHDRKRVQSHSDSNLDGQRRDQQDCRDVVQERWGHSRQQDQRRDDQPGVALGSLIEVECHPLKDVSLRQDGHENHHPQNQENHVPVHNHHGVFKGQDVQFRVESPPDVGHQKDRNGSEQRCGCLV